MKGLKYAELANSSDAQLKKQIAENRSRITALSFQKSVGQLDNTAQFKTLRRDIARMETSIQSRKSAAK
jgi:large subunit ribosomal protein L29